MYPAGAYVTYEHEYILIFRKGGKRKFDARRAAQKRERVFLGRTQRVVLRSVGNQRNKPENRQILLPAEKRFLPFRNTLPADQYVFYQRRYRLRSFLRSRYDKSGLHGFREKQHRCRYRRSDLQKCRSKSEKKTDAVNEIIDKRIDRHISFISSLSDDKRKNVI